MAGSVALIAVVASVLYDLRRRRHEQHLARLRSQGDVALARGDHRTAADRLGAYVQHEPVDAAAYLRFAEARLLAPQPDAGHLQMAYAALDHALAMHPTDRNTVRALMSVCLQAGRDERAIEMADRILAEVPDDRRAACVKAEALGRMGRHKEALTYAKRCAEAQHHDLTAHMRVLRLMKVVGDDPAAIVDYANRLAVQHQQSPAPVLLKAVAHRLADQRESAIQALQLAADMKSVDALYVRVLIDQFDAFGLYDQSIEQLQQAVTRLAEPPIARMLVRRLWERGRDKAVIDRLARVEGDADLLIWKGLAHLRLEQQSQARDVASQLRALSDDGVAGAWSAVLHLAADADRNSPQAMISACEKALLYQPSHPSLPLLVAQAWSRLGEKALASSAWRRAAELAPASASPRRQLATASLDGGNKHMAKLWAREALERASDDANMKLCLAAANGDGAQIRQILNQHDRLDQAVLYAAAGANDQVASAVLRYLHRAYGMSPRLAFAMAKCAGPAGALQMFDQLSTGAAIDHQISRAQVLETIDDPAAGNTWKALADDHVDNLPLQRLAVEADSTQSDRAFIDRAINRIRRLTGDRAMEWRMARSRWHLAAGTDRDLYHAATLLHEVASACPDWMRANLLLADCLESIGSREHAAKRVRTALQLDPDNDVLKQRLLRLQ